MSLTNDMYHDLHSKKKKKKYQSSSAQGPLPGLLPGWGTEVEGPPPAGELVEADWQEARVLEQRMKDARRLLEVGFKNATGVKEWMHGAAWTAIEKKRGEKLDVNALVEVGAHAVRAEEEARWRIEQAFGRDPSLTPNQRSEVLGAAWTAIAEKRGEQLDAGALEEVGRDAVLKRKEQYRQGGGGGRRRRRTKRRGRKKRRRRTKRRKRRRRRTKRRKRRRRRRTRRRR